MTTYRATIERSSYFFSTVEAPHSNLQTQIEFVCRDEPTTGDGSTVPALDPMAAANMLLQGAMMVDLRSLADFCQGHVRGAINIPFEHPRFADLAKQIVPIGVPVILMQDDIPDTLCDDEADVIKAADLLAGCVSVAGYVDGGICAWYGANLPLVARPVCQATPRDVATMLHDKRGGIPQIVDVREEWEWDAGHLCGAIHIPLSEIEQRAHELDVCRPTVVYCRSGARSQRAACLLAELGYHGIVNLAGGIQAWRQFGYAVVCEDVFAA